MSNSTERARHLLLTFREGIADSAVLSTHHRRLARASLHSSSTTLPPWHSNHFPGR